MEKNRVIDLTSFQSAEEVFWAFKTQTIKPGDSINLLSPPHKINYLFAAIQSLHHRFQETITITVGSEKELITYYSSRGAR